MQLFPAFIKEALDASNTRRASVLRIAATIKCSIPFAFPKDLPILEFALDQVTLALDGFRKDALLQNEHLALIFGRGTQAEGGTAR